MARFRFGCILILLLPLAPVLLPHAASFAGDNASPSISATPGFSGFFRSGHFVPVNVKIQNDSRSIEGRLIISSDTMVIGERVKLSAPSAPSFSFLLAPQALHPAIDVRLVSQGKVVAAAKVHSLKAVPPAAALVVVLGGTPACVAELSGKLPAGSQTCSVQPAELPDDFRGYEAVDLLVIGDPSWEPGPGQVQAMTDWLAGGGRMLVVRPPSGTASISPVWQRVLPHETPPAGQDGGARARALRMEGLRFFRDDRYKGCVGFPVGLGKVLLAAYGTEPANAGRDGRAAPADEILEGLGLQTPRSHAPNPLLEPNVYDLFPAAGWPRATKRAVLIAAIGYALLMALTMLAVRGERPAVCAATLAGTTAVVTAAIYFMVLPRSAVTLGSACVAETRAGASVLSVTRFIGFGSPAERDFTIELAAPAKPLFFSDVMLSRGPVHAAMQPGRTAVQWELSAGKGTPLCLVQAGVARFEGTIQVQPQAADAYTITNKAVSLATNEPIGLADVILTDGAEAVAIPDLPWGKPLAVGFAPAARAPLERLVWDTFAAADPFRYRVLRRWVRQHPPASGVYLLGWNHSRPMPEVGGRFLSVTEADTLWEIRIK